MNSNTIPNTKPNKSVSSEQINNNEVEVSGAFPIDYVLFPKCINMDISKFLEDPSERIWTEPFTFVHAADTQFGLIEKYFLKLDNPRWDVEIKLTSKAINIINNLKPKPKFVMICGDMLDTRPGTDEEQSQRNEQYQDFTEVLKQLDPEIKIICACGNHDVGDAPSLESIEIYRKQFGPDFFSFWVGGVKFNVLNSQYWKSPETVKAHYEKQAEFINTISDKGARHLVNFQHIPFFISDPDEEDVVYLNVEKEHRFSVMDQLHNAGVKYIFCGHYHRNAGGKYKEIQQIVTSALGGPLGNDPSGFRLVHVGENEISSTYINVEEVPMSSKKIYEDEICNAENSTDNQLVMS